MFLFRFFFVSICCFVGIFGVVLKYLFYILCCCFYTFIKIHYINELDLFPKKQNQKKWMNETKNKEFSFRLEKLSCTISCARFVLFFFFCFHTTCIILVFVTCLSARSVSLTFTRFSFYTRTYNINKNK